MSAPPTDEESPAPQPSPSKAATTSAATTTTASEIISGFLWLADARTALDPETGKRFALTHVVNATNRCVPNTFASNGVLYHNVDLDDSEESDIKAHFAPVHDFIDTAGANNGRVLVHCMCGVSRSASLVIAYVMMSEKVNLAVAFDRVKAARPIVSPNPRFARALMALERELTDGGVITVGEGQENSMQETDMVSPTYYRFKRDQAAARDARGALDRLAAGNGRNKRSCCSMM